MILQNVGEYEAVVKLFGKDTEIPAKLVVNYSSILKMFLLLRISLLFFLKLDLLEFFSSFWIELKWISNLALQGNVARNIPDWSTDCEAEWFFE